MITKQQLKNLFNKIKKTSLENRELSTKFQKAIKEYYGFSYDERDWLIDNDEIIDSLDYGTFDLSFEKFNKLMNTKNFQEVLDLK